jgi:UDP-N-acetylglucosamine diphosphorylase/glucosamine-1-phosphate N-acetyltransferase
MHYILFDDNWQQFQPLTFTRPVAQIRIGILTIAEKWQKMLPQADFGYLTQTYLSAKYPHGAPTQSKGQIFCYINASVLPNAALIAEIDALELGAALWKEGVLLACKAISYPHTTDTPFLFAKFAEIQLKSVANPIILRQTWDIFTHNAAALKADYQLLTQGRTSQPLSSTNRVIGDEQNIFLEAGATAEYAILNVKDAPIYLAKDAEIMEGALIRGGLALGEGATVKMGAKMYGANTIGAHSKVAGEVSNSVIFGYSNKGHEGFLGNAVIGEWCNLGADTNNSNLKNNYSPVEMWSYASERFVDTNLLFCGLIMGDHSKCGINTMFNTGTTVGVSVNFFGEGYPAKHIPSFAWGNNNGFATYKLEKALDTAEKVMARRHLPLQQVDKDIICHIFEQTQPARVWE